MDHEFPPDEQWGDTPETLSSSIDYAAYSNQIVTQHLFYFLRHDGNDLEDIIDQCVFTSQASSEDDDLVFYDAHETEVLDNESTGDDPDVGQPIIIP